MASQPNIVLIVTDDQRFDALGCAGNPIVQTPHMDALARRGVHFTQACIPCGTHGAVCMPSRAMLNTGRTLFHLQGSGEEIPPGHTTLGEAFRGAGYRTFGTGKWHNGTAAFHRSFTEGAEIFFGGMADHWNVPVFDLDPSGKYDKRCLVVDDPWTSNATRERMCDHIHSGKHSTDIIAAATVEFLEGYRDPAPFLAYVAFLAPHDPRTMPRKYLDLYDPAAIPLPPNFMGGHPFDNGDLHLRDEMLAGFPRNPDEIQRHLAEYYAMISHLDARVGDIVEAVRRRGKLDDTIFVLCGDNGLALGQHGLMGKQNLYEHSVRVPLMLAGPGVPQGISTPAQVYLLDIFPTLCALSGIKTPASVEGLDLGSAMRLDQVGRALRRPASAGSVVPAVLEGRNALYLAYADKHRGVRTERWKLIEYVVNGRHSMTQLFDLQADPWELWNLATSPEYAGTLSQLRQELIRLREAWDDRQSEWGQRFWSGCCLN
jgi:arylsulfatase A-like enzyme